MLNKGYIDFYFLLHTTFRNILVCLHNKCFETELGTNIKQNTNTRKIKLHRSYLSTGIIRYIIVM